MGTKRKIPAILLTICLMTALAPTAAFGATKTITSITIRVGTNTRAGETLNENIGVYSASTAAQDGTYAAVNSDKYYLRNAEWTTSVKRAMTVGEEPQMKLYLEIQNSDYAFRGTYSSGNITVRGGSFISARRKSAGSLEVTVKLDGIKGAYNPPRDAVWRDYGYGQAQWSVDERNSSMTSGYYDVYLYRGNGVVKKLENYQGTSYNFYPYMTRQGTYHFKVRTVPFTETQKKYGQRSEWLESDEIYIDADHVSDGSGQTDSNGIATGAAAQVGWVDSGGVWFYRYPDGSYQKDSWLKINNKWYLFDRDGRMLTGWQTKDGLTYYMRDNGEMYTGWLRDGNSWYYLNGVSDGVEGAMHIGWLQNNGRRYCMAQNGVMLEGWNQVDSNWYYFYPGYGTMAADAMIDTFYVDSNGVWRK